MAWRASYDPQLNVLYVNVNEIPTINRLRPVIESGTQGNRSPAQLGLQIYQARCMACHGSDRKGNPPQIPALTDLDLSRPEEKAVIQRGRNAMPAFTQLGDAELAALAAYVSHPPADAPLGSPNARRYTLDGYILFTDAQGFPGISPPWGTLNAIDLVTGNILWKVPLGEYPELAAKGIHNTGTMNFGGAVGYPGRRALRRRYRRRQDPRVRDRLRTRALGIATACRRLRHSQHLHGERQGIRGDCSRGRWQGCH